MDDIGPGAMFYDHEAYRYNGGRQEMRGKVNVPEDATLGRRTRQSTIDFAVARDCPGLYPKVAHSTRDEYSDQCL